MLKMQHMGESKESTSSAVPVLQIRRVLSLCSVLFSHKTALIRNVHG